MGMKREKTKTNRRGLAAWPGVFLAVVCAMQTFILVTDAQAAQPHGRAEPVKPNIIFILTDDLASNLVQFMPNLLQMQREGTSFSNFFVTDSLCCPSRSSIFTGRLPHNTGVFTNSSPDGGYKAFNVHGNEPLTFAIALKGAGYRTAMLGKYLNGYEPAKNGVAAGWDEWDVGGGDGHREFQYHLNRNGHVAHYGSKRQDYLTDVLSDLADDFIRQSAPGPFFIEIATYAPHAPYIPAPRDSRKFPDLAAPRSAAFGARPDSKAPNWLQAIPPLSAMDIRGIDRGFRMRAQAVQAIDQMIGRIRATLAALGDHDTYVVFSSDNGLHMGEYSLHPGKRTPFDIDIHVPLVVVGPGIPQGYVVTAITENIDLAPTFAELARAAPLVAADGRSLVPLLRGERVADWRNAALIEHHQATADPTDPDEQPAEAGDPNSYEALRTGNALYVEYLGGEVGYYDLTRDPDELSNIAASLPAVTRARLHDILRANAECKGAQACWAVQRMVP